jgi:hypothetical protein
VLQGKDLAADALGNEGIGYKKAAEDDEELGRLVTEQIPDHRYKK